MQKLDVTVENLENGGLIPAEFAFGVPAEDELITFGIKRLTRCSTRNLISIIKK